MVYKPDSMSTDEFIIIIEDPIACDAYSKGDKSKPLVEILGSFDVYHSGQGSQGLLQRPSKQELETVFATTNEDEIVEKIIAGGKLISSDAPLKFGGGRGDNMKGGHSQQTSRGAVGGGR